MNCEEITFSSLSCSFGVCGPLADYIQNIHFLFNSTLDISNYQVARKWCLVSVYPFTLCVPNLGGGGEKRWKECGHKNSPGVLPKLEAWCVHRFWPLLFK
jgi:hypothetical protein